MVGSRLEERRAVSRDGGAPPGPATDPAHTLLAAAAHDLTNPLSIVMLCLDTLHERGEGLTPAQREIVMERALAGGRRMYRILNGLLDAERVAKGVLRACPRPTDVVALIRGVVEETEIGSRRPVRVEAGGAWATVDPVLLERIVENLLANADRHTPAGTPVEVLVNVDGGDVVIAVEDHGPGVAGEGGLGLSLVARFAELHGGSTGVRELPQGGSSFWVRLPSRPGRAAPLGPAR